jgi:hypothetical protein
MKYKLKKDQTFRMFGTGEVLSNDNITDEKVEAILKLQPELEGKIFIDTTKEEAPALPPAPPASIDDELNALTKKDLHAKYFELTGKAADEKANKEALVALVKAELEAKAALG